MIAHSEVHELGRPLAFSPNSAQGHAVSDQMLIGAIARGEQKAMRRLYERHSLRVYRFARRLGADHCAAEELVSEVFLEAWRGARAFEGRAQVSTWLLAIARNRTLDTIRRKPLEQIDEDACRSIEDQHDGPELAVQKRQAASALTDALDSLSPAHRSIIDLVYYHEKSIGEVARILDIPPSTVKTRMFYARKRLWALLRERGQDAEQLLA